MLELPGTLLTRSPFPPREYQARAFESFVAESGDWLLQVATLLAPDPHAAEDICQETLQRLAAGWPRIGNPKAFCRRIMHNLVIDQARARGRRPRELQLSPSHDSGDPRSADPLAAAELRPALIAALGTLTAQQRSIIVLRYFDDRSEAEVADLLGKGLPVRTIWPARITGPHSRSNIGHLLFAYHANLSL